MRVLILGSKEYPAMFKLEGCGGIEVHVQALARNLQKRNVELFLVTRKGAEQNWIEHEKSLHVYRVPYVSGKYFRTFTFNLLSFFLSLHLTRKYRVHLIHANDFTSGFFGALLKVLLNRPLLLSAPVFGSRQPEWPSVLRGVLQLFERVSLGTADSIFLFTPKDVEYARSRYGLVGKAIEFLGNGVEIERFETARPLQLSGINAQIRPESKIIIFVGRLTKSKGLDVLIQAFSQLAQEGGICLLIVGNGPELGRIMDIVEQRCLRDRVVFLGVRRDVERVLAASYIFVLPSLYEGFPVVLLEAMAARKPIVATRVGAIPTVIRDGVNGVLVKPNDPQELADKLSTLLQDDGLCLALSEKAYQTVRESYSWAAVAERVCRRYLFLSQDPSLSREAVIVN